MVTGIATVYFQDSGVSSILHMWVEKNKETFNTLPDIIFVKDLDFRYAFANSNFVKLYPDLGDKTSQVTDYEIFPHYMVAQFRETDRIVLDISEAVSYTSNHDIKGEKIYYKTTKSPIILDDETIGLLGIARNITDEVRMTEQIGEQNLAMNQILEQYKKLVDNSPNGVAISQGRYPIFVNKKYTELIGRSAEEIFTAPPEERWTRESLELMYKYVKMRQEGKKAPDEYEVEVIHKDGTVIPVLHRVVQIELPEFEDPVSISYMQDLRDIREKERLEKIVLTRQNQQTRTSALGNLASGLAHQINNLLTPIYGYSSLLTEELQGDHLRYINSIRSTTDELAKLTQSILDFTGAGGGTEIRTLELDELVETSKPLFSTISDNLDYQLNYDREIRVDPREFRQLLINLIKNAEEANLTGAEEGNGMIILSTGEETLSPEDLERRQLFGKVQPGDFICIAVTNSGSRLGVEGVDRLFEPYYSSKEFGRGLGLSVCLGIVQSYDGMIEVSVDDNTTFKVLLPIIHQS